jgi:DNA-directed RNA polymerase specialized sigma24 family protein
MSHLQKEDGPQLDFEFKGVNRGLLERGYLSVAGPDYAWFKKAITRLNQRQATAVRLIVCRQYSITEAADNESISEESMRNILNQAFYRIASSHPAFSPQSINPTDQWVRHACEHMTSRQRDVFDLCFNQALSVGEAAQHLGLHKSSLQGSKMAVVLKLATFYTGTLSVIATATQQSA